LIQGGPRCEWQDNIGLWIPLDLLMSNVRSNNCDVV